MFCPQQSAGIVVDLPTQTARAVTALGGVAHFCICGSVVSPCAVNVYADGVLLRADIPMSNCSNDCTDFVIKWADNFVNAAGIANPELGLHPPDGMHVVTSPGGSITFLKFDDDAVYDEQIFASTLGVSLATLGQADFVCFDLNATAGLGFEPANWTFRNGAAPSTGPIAMPAGALSTGSLTPAAYQSLFNLSSPPAIPNGDVPWILVDLPSPIEPLAPDFRVDIQAGPGSNDTPDPDALGVLDFAGPAAPSDGTLGVHGRDWLHDAFPFNEDETLPGTIDFDTTTAMIKTGHNIAQMTGDAMRPVIPGDTLVACACGDDVRMDMVFRVKPGVGNYLTRGNRGSGLREFGTGFFTSYKTSPGAFSGLPGSVNPSAAIAAHLSAPSGWSEHVWNSARMDTAEANLFPVEACGNLPQIEPCSWAGMYHETELAARPSLGIARNRCFLVDPQGAIDESNIVCGSAPGWLTMQTGWDGQVTTTEGTKIIPDGLLTPGAHVQYFLRRTTLSTPGVFSMLPDTNRVTGQTGEVNDPVSDCCSAVLGAGEDGHRWQQFGVLPDRWKDGAFGEGGLGMACMLYVDMDDGFGDERAWVVAADKIGATAPTRFGAHNGWHIPEPTDDPNDPVHFVSLHGGQPGSSWDMYGVRGVDDPLNGYAGSIGSRLSPAPLGSAAGKQARIGPTERMLWTYYRTLFVTTGRFDDRILGPVVDRGQDDVQMLNAFRERSIGGNSRGCVVMGSGFATSEAGNHPALLETLFGAELRNSSYPALSGNAAACVDMEATSLTSPYSPPGAFGVKNPVASTNDVLQTSSLSTAAEAGYFFDPGGGPFVACTVAQPFGVTNWTGLLGAWDLQDLDGRFCPETGIGRAVYLADMFSTLFGALCSIVGTGGPTTDASSSAAPVEPLRVLRNPVTGGQAVFSLSLVAGGHVDVTIRDVAGRRIRTLSSGPRAPGSHELVWDGMDDRGTAVRSGIYFVQVRLPDTRPLSRPVVWMR
jgi:hypothetical protein